MSNVTLESLQNQLTQFENDFKVAESNLYRLDGAIQLLKHLIAEEAKPAEDSVEKQDK